MTSNSGGSTFGRSFRRAVRRLIRRQDGKPSGRRYRHAQRRPQCRRARQHQPPRAVDLTYLDALHIHPGEPAAPDGDTPGRSYFYRPDGTPIVDDGTQPAFMTWALQGTAPRRVASTTYYRHGVRLRISTVYIGLDMSCGTRPPPMIYETMIFGDGRVAQWRYASREAALRGHRAVCHAMREERRSRAGKP